jgi:subtilisin family serine protease
MPKRFARAQRESGCSARRVARSRRASVGGRNSVPARDRAADRRVAEWLSLGDLKKFVAVFFVRQHRYLLIVFMITHQTSTRRTGPPRRRMQFEAKVRWRNMVVTAYRMTGTLLVLLLAIPASAGTFQRAERNGVRDVYSVVLADDVAEDLMKPPRGLPRVGEVAQSLARTYGGSVRRTWEYSVQGFVVTMTEARARKLAQDPRVKSVEQDVRISADVPVCRAATAWTAPTPSQPASPQTTNCSNPDPALKQCSGNWGLDRSDQPNLPLNNSYSFTQNGTNVNVYVLDYGVRGSHQEFRKGATTESRVTAGIDVRDSGDPARSTSPGANSDCHGHGTHVAAIIGGLSFGIAKDVKIHPVRIGSCAEPKVSFYLTSLASGLEEISKEVKSKRDAGETWPAVINFSGGNFTGAWMGRDDIAGPLTKLLAANVVVVQSAGNHEPAITSTSAKWKDACDYTFGGLYPDVVVVGGSDYEDGRWTKSGCTSEVECGSIGGSCVDLWAPAKDVLSAWYTADNHACTMSGTSMAAPHVTGVIAAYLGANPKATIAEVQKALRSRGSWGRLQASTASASYIGPDSDNVLLQSGVTSLGDNIAPVAAFTATCPGLQCVFDASASADEDADPLTYAWRFHDGSTATGVKPRRDFSESGDGWAVLEASDGVATDHLRVQLKVGTDKPPVAAFPAPSCTTAGACTFDSSSSQDDGTITARKWSFGDGQTSTVAAPKHTYAKGGTYSVELTVTDNAGQTGTVARSVTVEKAVANAPSSVTAVATGTTVTITWQTASGTDGYRVERKVSSLPWEQVVVVEGANTTSATDTPTTSSGVVLYRVLGRAGSVFSETGVPDIAWVGNFTGPVIGAPGPDGSLANTTKIRAVHLTELRSAVNTLWSIAGQATPIYSTSEVTAEEIREKIGIDETHWTQLLEKLNHALTTAGVPKNVSFETTPTADAKILRTQVDNLRDGFK